ncbi:AAA family ATPase [Endozoicomonas sp. SCSIO W0465]|uniref:transglutaminase domain-containing protein n=1 Tax=Endozoicomonas sp. SCSIO W0465 TaxID=2918516 RepID=UPI00207579D8|nr:AAA family ATPase [Endozoicomonas sp. SCSIO W0465]USE36945.1 AAA family ATPase [Endozoicomonas sp. SCSIO W0465]
MNELLEDPPRLDGMPVSTTVNRVVLANEELIRQPDAPGPDFWRRIFAFNGPSSATFSSDGSPHKAVLPSWSVRYRTKPPEPGSLLIRCTGKDAFAGLFGNLAINNDGRQYFHKGLVSSQSGPVTICLVDPPDRRSRFWQQLSDILEQGYFLANGEQVMLPPSLSLEQYHTPTADIDAFKLRVNNTPVKPDKTCGIINSLNFDTICSDLSAWGSTLQQIDTFQKMASEFGQLCITGELTDDQWRVLKQRMELLSAPPGLVTGTLPGPPGELLGKSIVRLQTSDVANAAAESDSYHLARGQSWEELWFTSELKLSGKLSFRLTESPLLKKLLAGKTVLLTGLEHSPVLAGHLESLLAPEPYLWIYGQKIDLPHCRIHIVWPIDHLPARGPWSQRWQQQQKTGSRGPASSVSTIMTEAVMANHPDAAEPLTRLLDSIRTLPQSPDKSYPTIPVQAPSEFLTLLESQMHIEQSLDRSKTLEPFHWRKALNKLLAHPTRGDATVYSFVKAQINAQFPDKEAGVDSDGIVDILKTRPFPKLPKDLTDDFWPLARYMVPALAHSLPHTFDKIPAHCLAKMAGIIHSMFPEEGIRADSVSDITDNLHSLIPSYQGHRLRLLYDALLVMASDSHYRGIPVHQQAMILNHQLSLITQHHPSDPVPQLQQHLQQQLQHCFPDQLLTTTLQTLATDWLKACRSHNQQQAKRLTQLTAMLRQHKIIDLNGPAGTGKSCLALATGQALQQQQHSSMDWLVAAIDAKLDQQTVNSMTLGPDTTWEDLYGSVTLEKDMMGNLVSHSVPGQLSEWAKSSRPGLLIINEANLVHHGLLSPLTGLLQSPPRLCVNGQTIWLTDNHRVLLTGNPESYRGRNLDPELKSRILRLFYRPLPQSILKQTIIEPLLPETWPMERRLTASATILSLLAEYKKLVSRDYELTPRDLNDIMARFRMIAADAPCPASNEQVFALAEEACRQSLGGRIDRDQQSEWQALRTYWRSSGQVDDPLPGPHQHSFTAFFSQLTEVNQKRSQPLVIDTPATREYIKTCWQFLQLREPGRAAMVVEGTAGWGKDALLLLTLTTWQQQTGKGYQHFNGAPDQFAQFVEAFDRAWRLGEVLVVSELNIMPSGPLEEFLNDRLPLPHKAGFRLIGTINPPTYPGRTAFPPSLTSRFTRVLVNNDIINDYRLRLQAMGVPDILSWWLTACASAINNDFRRRRIPLELTLPQILQAADQLAKTTMDRWTDSLMQAWKPYLACLSDPGKKWPCIPGQSSRQSSEKQSSKASPTEPAKIFSLGRAPGVSAVFQVTRYFPREWDTDLYRLELHTVSVTADQQLASRQLSGQLINRNDLLSLLPWRGSLQAGETPGRMALEPGNEWQSLPSLTPADRLSGVRTIPEQAQLELAKDNQTGQYVVRSPMAEPVTVDFIIHPDLTYFEPLTFDHSISTLPGRCPALIKVHLDKEVFSRKPTHSRYYRELHKIADIRNLPERLLALADWFRTFSYDRNYTEAGINLVMRLIKEKQGSCRHRAYLFQLLCLYWGIEARIVKSVSHAFVEIRCEGGWRLFDLSGTGKTTCNYSSEPDWDSLYQSGPVQSVNSPCESDSGESASGWERILSLVISLCQKSQCTSSELPREAIKIIREIVQEEFWKNFCPIPMGPPRQFFCAPRMHDRIYQFDIAYHIAPEQYLLAARHAIDHFSTLALPEKKAIIDWSHCMLNWSIKHQSPKDHLFCQWSEFAWQLYRQKPDDFPVLPIQSLQAVTRFNFDHNGMALRICQRIFRLESINRTCLEAVSNHPEEENFSLLYDWEKLPEVPVTEVYWCHSSRGKPDIARLIRGEPCFPEKKTFYQQTPTLMFSAQFLIGRALETLKQTPNKLTRAPFVTELELEPKIKFAEDYINHAELNWQLIRLISDKRSAEIYAPVVCKELSRFRVLIVGNFDGQITLFESPAGQNFNLIGSEIFSQGIAMDCRESLEKIKGLINEHDATILGRK